MKKIRYIIIIFIIFIIILNISPNVFAKSNSLLNYLWPDDETSEWFNFYPSNDSIYQGTKSSKTTKLREKTLSNVTSKSDNRDVYVDVSWSVNDYSIRYHWLHALKKLTDENKSKDYKKISEENDTDTITQTIKAVESVRGELNTFFNNGKKIKDKDCDKTNGTWTEVVGLGRDAATETIRRSTDAFTRITGCNTYDEYLKVVNNQLVTLKAAEKYSKGEEVTKEWLEKITQEVEKNIKATENPDQKRVAEKMNENGDPDRFTVFNMPDSTAVASNGLKDLTGDADKFIEAGTAGDIIETEDLQSFSKNIYGMLLGVGIVLAVIIGVIIGVKLMLAPIEKRAEAKKLLIPYVVGCIIVFGSFAIWRFVVTLMQQI